MLEIKDEIKLNPSTFEIPQITHKIEKSRNRNKSIVFRGMMLNSKIMSSNNQSDFSGREK